MKTAGRQYTWYLYFMLIACGGALIWQLFFPQLGGVFTSWGVETPHQYERAELETILKELSKGTSYGTILRAKGMLPTPEGTWMYFDLTPGEYEIREGSPDYTGRLCVIGADLKEDALKEAFHLS